MHSRTGSIPLMRPWSRAAASPSLVTDELYSYLSPQSTSRNSLWFWAPDDCDASLNAHLQHGKVVRKDASHSQGHLGHPAAVIVSPCERLRKGREFFGKETRAARWVARQRCWAQTARGSMLCSGKNTVKTVGIDFWHTALFLQNILVWWQ